MEGSETLAFALEMVGWLLCSLVILMAMGESEGSVAHNMAVRLNQAG